MQNCMNTGPAGHPVWSTRALIVHSLITRVPRCRSLLGNGSSATHIQYYSYTNVTKKEPRLFYYWLFNSIHCIIYLFSRHIIATFVTLRACMRCYFKSLHEIIAREPCIPALTQHQQTCPNAPLTERPGLTLYEWLYRSAPQWSGTHVATNNHVYLISDLYNCVILLFFHILSFIKQKIIYV